MKIKISILLICIILSGLFFAPKELDLDDRINKVAQSLYDYSGFVLKGASRIKLKLLDGPKLIIYNAIIQDEDSKYKQVKIRQIETKLSLAKLIFGNIKPTNLLIIGAKLDLNHLSNMSSNFIRFDMSYIDVQESEILIDNQNSTPTILEDLSFFMSQEGLIGSSIKIESRFTLYNSKYTLEANLGDIDSNGNSNDMSATLDNNHFRIDFSGTAKNVFSDLVTDGKLKFTIPSNSLFKSDITADSHMLYQGGVAHLSNGVIRSDIVESGAFTALMQNKNGRRLNVNIAIKHLNLSTKGQDDANDTNKIPEIAKSISGFFDAPEIPHNLSSHIDINVSDISLPKNKGIKDFQFISEALGGAASIDRLSFDAISGESKSKFRFNGILSHNGIRPKIEGKMFFVTSDFSAFVPELQKKQLEEPIKIASDISLIPGIFALNNIKGILGKRDFKGSLRIKHGAMGKISNNLSFEIQKIDLDKYNIVRKIQKYISKLFISDIDKTGKKYNELTDDFKFLREREVEWQINAKAHKAKFMDTLIQSPYIYFTIKKNEFLLHDLYVKAKPIAFSVSGALSSQNLKPNISINAKIGRLDTEFINKIFPIYDALLNKIRKGGGFASDINLFSIGYHDGDIKISANKVRHNGLKIEKLTLDSSIKDGIWNIKNFSAGLMGGSISGEGYFVTNSNIPKFSANLIMSDVRIREFLERYYKYSNLSGYVNASGKIESRGTTIQEIFSNASGNLKVLGKKIVMHEYNIHDISKIIDIQMSLDQKLETIKEYTNNGETEFDDMSGDILVAGGVAKLSNFILKGGDASASFAGHIGLSQKTISSILQTSFIPYKKRTPLNIIIKSSGKPGKILNDVDISDIRRAAIKQNTKFKLSAQRNKSNSILRNQRR